MRVGVDLGGTKIEALALDDNGIELQRIRVSTPRGDYDGTVQAIADLVRELETATGTQGTVGVGIPGTIVESTGLVKNANSTWINDKPFQVDLCTALDREVRCANDANCLAVSEATDGSVAGVAVVFAVIMGTGCGGGIALNGHVHAGRNGIAGEWGHTPLPWANADEYPGPACYCGRYGCLETWISGTGFENDYARRTGEALRGKDIVASAREGDAKAITCIDRLQDRLARGLAVIANILDPDAIVIGGGLSNMDELYIGVSERISGYAFGGSMYTPVLKAKHGDSSGVRGAAWLWPAKR